jgi:hypothetical protein
LKVSYHAGQVFPDYQWDLLLLEAGFLGWLPARVSAARR